METLMQIELQVIAFLQDMGSWLEIPMQAFTFFGNELFFLLFMPAIFWSIDPRLGFRTGMMLILSGGLNSCFKIVFHSPRPFWIEKNVIALSSENSFGFPSGHSQNSTAIWGMVGATVKKKWLTFMVVLLIFFIGVSRLYLGMHFLRDVLGGWLVGALIIFAYIKLEPSVQNWLSVKSHVQQQVIAFLFSVAIILLGVLSVLSAGKFNLPIEWTQNAINAGVEAPNPYSLDGVITIAGVAFGFTSGYAWWKHKFHEYKISPSPLRRVLRYLIGLLGVVILYFGLKMVFPENPFIVGLGLRYIRYTLIGFWVTGLAPLVFKLLRLNH